MNTRHFLLISVTLHKVMNDVHIKISDTGGTVKIKQAPPPQLWVILYKEMSFLMMMFTYGHCVDLTSMDPSFCGQSTKSPNCKKRPNHTDSTSPHCKQQLEEKHMADDKGAILNIHTIQVKS